MNREELLEALTLERYDNRWWITPTAEEVAAHDNDLTRARRRKALLDNDSAHNYAKEA